MAQNPLSPARSGKLTPSEWSAVISSAVFLILWLGISFS